MLRYLLLNCIFLWSSLSTNTNDSHFTQIYLNSYSCHQKLFCWNLLHGCPILFCIYLFYISVLLQIVLILGIYIGWKCSQQAFNFGAFWFSSFSVFYQGCTYYWLSQIPRSIPIWCGSQLAWKSFRIAFSELYEDEDVHSVWCCTYELRNYIKLFQCSFLWKLTGY